MDGWIDGDVVFFVWNVHFFHFFGRWDRKGEKNEKKKSFVFGFGNGN